MVSVRTLSTELSALGVAALSLPLRFVVPSQRFDPSAPHATPVVLVQRFGNNNVITSTRDPNGCVSIWVDGTQWQSITPGDIDEFIKPWELGALEVYSATTTPIEFQGANRGKCMTVVAWTHRRLDRRR